MQKEAKPPSPVRCAIYTRKSTEHGLNREFNSLDGQREACVAYIASQRHANWIAIERRYDDGGFTGANAERPALRRLLHDIETGQIDCLLVYKVDRLSRSLLDFAHLMSSFEKHHVSFVSVTQHFDTSQSMGRLTLNILLSFAQFEREIISERTRDKMGAARRKGKWCGGTAPLGFDVDRENRRLVVNPDEAERVRAIFELYLEQGGLIPTVDELGKRSWNNKQWTTRKGRQIGGRPFTKTRLHYLLTNITYRGKTKYDGKIYPGEHESIVSADLFRGVGKQLHANRREKRRKKAEWSYGLLKGLLHCTACQAPMFHSYASKGSRRYRYYVCSSAQKRGWETCPVGSIPAAEIEDFVVGEIEEGRGAPLGPDGQWEALSMLTRADALAKLICRVEYDGRDGDLRIELANGELREST